MNEGLPNPNEVTFSNDTVAEYLEAAYKVVWERAGTEAVLTSTPNENEEREKDRIESRQNTFETFIIQKNCLIEILQVSEWVQKEDCIEGRHTNGATWKMVLSQDNSHSFIAESERDNEVITFKFDPSNETDKVVLTSKNTVENQA